MRGNTRCYIQLILLGLVACQRSQVDRVERSGSDSAGFVVKAVGATSVGSSSKQALDLGGDTADRQQRAIWTLDRGLEIGSVDDAEYEFIGIDGVLGKSDGSVILLDSNAKELRQYDGDGKLLNRWGRSGSGPGEFTLPVAIGWWMSTDSVWVDDPVRRRVTVFRRDGSVVRTFELQELHLVESIDPPNVVGFFRDGSAVALVEDEETKTDSMMVRLLRLPKRDTAVQIARLRSPGDVVAIRSKEGGLVHHPLPDGPLIGFPPLGLGVVLVERLAYGGHGTPTIALQGVDANGHVLWVREIAYVAEAVPSDVKDSLKVVLRATFDRIFGRRGLSKRQVETILDKSVQIPQYYPPITSVVIAESGEVWVQWRQPGNGRLYTVIRGDGRVIADVRGAAPSGGGLVSVAGDFAWSVERDSLGVPTLVRWRVKADI